MSPERYGVGWAPARVSLAGNPSDGYGGAVLALALDRWSAHARASLADRLTLRPDSRLVRATVRRFARELEPRALNTAIHWESAIPRDVGLAGSSAVVIAVLRALCDLFGVALGRERLAELALAVELHELGIQAGPQDRVAQAHGGLTFMDFVSGRHEALDPGLLPALLIAWRPEAGGPSGDTHAALRRRFADGEPSVLEGIGELAGAARRARAGLLAGELDEFRGAIDATMDVRRRMLVLDPRCLEMVEAARRSGASANYTGSGGAIVAAPGAPAQLGAVRQALERLGCHTARWSFTTPSHPVDAPVTRVSPLT